MKFDLANEERVGMGFLWMGAAGSMAMGQEETHVPISTSSII